MSTLSMQAAPSLGHPMEKLLDNYMMAERGGGAGVEEGGGGAAFMLEDGGMISYTGVFMDDEEDSDDDASDSSTEAEVMAHLHAALGGSVASTNASGSTSSSSSSGSTSTSGGTVSAAPEGDSKGEGCKYGSVDMGAGRGGDGVEGPFLTAHFLFFYVHLSCFVLFSSLKPTYGGFL